MTAPVFDAVVLGSLAVVAILIWVVAFGARLPGGTGSVDPLAAVGLRDSGPGLAEVFKEGGNTDLHKVFAASAASFREEVKSFRGDSEVAISVTGRESTRMNLGMRFAFEAPGRMYMQLDAPAGHNEILMNVPNVYVRPDGREWYLLTVEGLGLSPDALQRLLEQRGVVDYAAQAGVVNGLIQLPDEEIDGETFFHYGGQLDFAQALNGLPPGFLDPTILNQVAAAGGPIRVETWLDKETALPRRMTIDIEMSLEGTLTSMVMRMDFLDYNRPVYIPDAPVDARPITDLNVAGEQPAPGS
jgi:hypothetical protein